MVVQHNLTAMNSNRMLGVVTGKQAKSSEKLSSGYKINRAADDAAGLSISEKMRKQINGLDRASSNAQDGVSAVQTAEGALTEVHSMLQRMNELAVQAANGTNSESDREAIQAEIEQLTTEIDRVAETTKFNESYLLRGDQHGASKTQNVNAHDAGIAGKLTDGTDDATFVADNLAVGKTITIDGKDYTIVADEEEDEGENEGENEVAGQALVTDNAQTAPNAVVVNTEYGKVTTYEIDEGGSSGVTEASIKFNNSRLATDFYKKVEATKAETTIDLSGLTAGDKIEVAGTEVTVTKDITTLLSDISTAVTSGLEDFDVSLEENILKITAKTAGTKTAINVEAKKVGGQESGLATATAKNGEVAKYTTIADDKEAIEILKNNGKLYKDSNGSEIAEAGEDKDYVYTPASGGTEEKPGGTEGVDKPEGGAKPESKPTTSTSGAKLEFEAGKSYSDFGVAATKETKATTTIDLTGFKKDDTITITLPAVGESGASPQTTITGTGPINVKIEDGDGLAAIKNALNSNTTFKANWEAEVDTTTNKLILTAKNAGTNEGLTVSGSIGGKTVNGTTTKGYSVGDTILFTSAEEMLAALEAGTTIVDENGNEATTGFTFTQASTAGSGTTELKLSEAVDKIKEALKKASSIGADRAATVTYDDAKQEFKITKGTVDVKDKLSFNLHVGADADMTNKINVEIEAMSAAGLGIKGINVSDDTGVEATYAIDAISDALEKVSSQRSALGAIQNRLEHTIDNLDNVVENTTSAESRIRDTDMAEEMVEYTKNNILAQAGQSMLAQANQSTQGVLSLLS